MYGFTHVLSARLAPSSRPLPSLFVAFLPFFVLPWPSPLRVINVIIIILQGKSTERSSAKTSRGGDSSQTLALCGVPPC